MEDNDSQTQLWLYATDGKTRRQLTQGGRKNTAPQWSPDGRSIAFVSRRGEGQRADESSQIYLLAVDGGEARRLTRLSTGIETFRWSPDGKSLIAISWVWPELEDDKAQAARLKARKEDKVQAKVIELESYRYWDHWICDGRRPQLFSIDARSGKAKNSLPDIRIGASVSVNLAVRASPSRPMAASSPGYSPRNRPNSAHPIGSCTSICARADTRAVPWAHAGSVPRNTRRTAKPWWCWPHR